MTKAEWDNLVAIGKQVLEHQNVAELSMDCGTIMVALGVTEEDLLQTNMPTLGRAIVAGYVYGRWVEQHQSHVTGIVFHPASEMPS